MAVKKYIEVSQPDRGLMNNVIPTDISPQHCSGCQNVFFENGVIKTRFGWGTAEITKLNTVASTALTEEVLHMVMFDESYDSSEPNRRLIALTKSYLIDWNDTDEWWGYDTTGLYHRLNDNTYPETDIVQAASVYGTYTTGSVNDIIYSLQDNGADATYDIRIKSGDPTSPNVFEVSKDSAAYAGDYNCGADEYTDTNVSLKLEDATGHTTNNITRINYVHTNRPTVSSVTTPAPPEITGNTYCLKLDIVSAYDTSHATEGPRVLFVRDDEGIGELYDADTISFWYYYDGGVTWPGTDLKIMTWPLVNAAGKPVAGMGGVNYPTATGGPTFDGTDKQTWKYAEITFSASDQTDLENSGYQNKRYIVFAFNGAVDVGDFQLYLCDIRVGKHGGSGLGEAIDTTEEATVSRQWVGSVDSTSGNRLYFTNKLGTVRYVASGSSRSLSLSEASDYNTAVDYHRARAISGDHDLLHLLGTIEEKDGSDTYHTLRDRYCDTLDADVWDAGVSQYSDITGTSGEILNSVQLDNNEYIFKSDGIVRTTFLGGETSMYDYDVVYRGDGLVAPRLVKTIGNYIYFVGRNNVYRYSGGGVPEPIGNPIKDALFDDLNYSDGQYHRRSWMFYIEEKNLLMIVVPTASAYPDKAYVWDLTYERWTIFKFGTNMTAGTSYYGLTTGNLDRGAQFGTSAGKFHKIDYDAEDDYANTVLTLIDSYWDSKEFGTEVGGRTEYKKWRGVHFEAKGDSVTVYYNADGAGWLPTAGTTKTLTSSWARYYVDFPVEAQLLKIRFRNATASSSFQIRWFSLDVEEGSVT
ncbi:MAG: hypothetical protein ABIG61_07310 [Planctomycetota bacterium]